MLAVGTHSAEKQGKRWLRAGLAHAQEENEQWSGLREREKAGKREKGVGPKENNVTKKTELSPRGFSGKRMISEFRKLK